MESRQFRWIGPTEEQQVALVWVPGTSNIPYAFGAGRDRRSMSLEGFFISTTPVTQALWLRVMGNNPAVGHDVRCPVENVSWQQITAPNGFLERLNASDVLSTLAQGDVRLRFRLPSEAEWEYAARGGPRWQDDLAFSGSNNPVDVAWFGPRWRRTDQALVNLLGGQVGWRLANRLRKLLPRHTRTHPVGSKAANQLGLFDMSGNVWEWCQDVCTDELEAIPGDGRPYLGSGTERRLRGGCHHNWDLHCRVWWRYGIEPAAHDGCIGFRVVLAPVGSVAH